MHETIPLTVDISPGNHFSQLRFKERFLPGLRLPPVGKQARAACSNFQLNSGSLVKLVSPLSTSSDQFRSCSSFLVSSEMMRKPPVSRRRACILDKDVAVTDIVIHLGINL